MQNFEKHFQKLAGTEVYTLVATPHPQATTLTKDLFAGL
jgi:hypothetical protein